MEFRPATSLIYKIAQKPNCSSRIDDLYIEQNYPETEWSKTANWNRKDIVLDGLPSKSWVSVNEHHLRRKILKKSTKFSVINHLDQFILSQSVILVGIKTMSISIFEKLAEKWSKLGTLHRNSPSSTVASCGSTKNYLSRPTRGKKSGTGSKNFSTFMIFASEWRMF